MTSVTTTRQSEFQNQRTKVHDQHPRAGKKAKETAASVDRTQYLQKSHVMRDSSELQSGALPGELKRLL